MIKVRSIFGNLNKEWTICLNNPKENLYSFEQNPNIMKQHIGYIRNSGKNTKNFRVIGNRCLQFIRLDRDEKYDQWVFIGAFENKGEKTSGEYEIYDLKLIDDFKEYKDRLIIKYKKKPGDKKAKLKHEIFLELDVVSILERPYIENVYPFPGYSNMTIPFAELKKIIELNIDNWRELLMNVQCVYCITDIKTGKLYIGSTYGKNGIWQRWSRYVETNGHGDDVELKKIIDKKPDYAINNFKFTILEPFFNTKSNESKIKEREQYWSKVFLTQNFGNYNRNLY